ncbi:MAG: hypothetical protein GY829_12185, partial [Gammaproteobacteria bacterium]|nr:hypothetical protein [Gammaproteobacteria bacterium]
DGFKTGVNKLDQNQIKKLNEAGKDAKEISLTLKIKIEAIEAFLPKKKARAKAKAKKED